MIPHVQLPLVARPVHPMTAPEVVQLIAEGVHRDSTLVIANLNLHALYLSETEPIFSRFLEFGSPILIDGWPVLLLARLGGARVSARHRIGSSDWLRLLLSADPEMAVVAIGGTESSARAAAAAVRARCQRLRWRSFDGYSVPQVLERSDQSALKTALKEADLVLVGMGMPRQERWILDNLSLLEGKIVANVGGCIDYLSGYQKESPRVLGWLGLEWLYRLLNDPRRLGYRYLVEPLKLAYIVGRRLAGTRRGLS